MRRKERYLQINEESLRTEKYIYLHSWLTSSVSYMMRNYSQLSYIHIIYIYSSQTINLLDSRDTGCITAKMVHEPPLLQMFFQSDHYSF